MSKENVLRRIPSVETLLSSAEVRALVDRFGRAVVKGALAEHLAAIRASREPGGVSLASAAAAVEEILERQRSRSLRRVINATGVLIHTNLGRSPIDAALWDRAGQLVTGYSNLEFDLDAGDRGARDQHVSTVASQLFGCEAAILTNNNAAAILLLLAAVARGKEVVVSRGELVEIGGSFRIPDVIQQGGASLREVGTTNRTRAADYESAVSRRAAALLRVHRSNFDIVGFTERPSLEELVAVARRKKRPLLYDEGSGCVVDLARYGFGTTRTVAQALAAGVDAVSCSTDKLIGATQGGLILARREIIDACRKHPLMRALRVGKETYAVVIETLRAFLAGRHEVEIPIYRMLSAPLDELGDRARALVLGADAVVIETRAVLGGGTTPGQTMPSIGIRMAGPAQDVSRKLLHSSPPIASRIHEESCVLDVRTILPEEDRLVSHAISSGGDL
jgi:L-seryl-tRNA(Ser) seleniumtransferase